MLHGDIEKCEARCSYQNWTNFIHFSINHDGQLCSGNRNYCDCSSALCIGMRQETLNYPLKNKAHRQTPCTTRLIENFIRNIWRTQKIQNTLPKFFQLLFIEDGGFCLPLTNFRLLLHCDRVKLIVLDFSRSGNARLSWNINFVLQHQGFRAGVEPEKEGWTLRRSSDLHPVGFYLSAKFSYCPFFPGHAVSRCCLW